MTAPIVTCVMCGHRGCQGMGMIASPVNEPHRWMCRNRPACRLRAPKQGVYRFETFGAEYSADGTLL